jgi:hypothetical protein
MGMKLDVLLCDQEIDELEPRSTRGSYRRVWDGYETSLGAWGRALPASIPWFGVTFLPLPNLHPAAPDPKLPHWNTVSFK